MKQKKIYGFSKLSKIEKITWIAKNFLHTNPIDLAREFAGFWHDNIEAQKKFDGFSENTISNFHMPFSVAPNFKINDKIYLVPMVTEESSVVAAASNAAKYWLDKGGFQYDILGTEKIGHIHFLYQGDLRVLSDFFPTLKNNLIREVNPIVERMRSRGGGIKKIELIDFSDKQSDYYQLAVTFDTCDSMGANFINSVLETMAHALKRTISTESIFTNNQYKIDIIMSILSNYTPQCAVKAQVSCPVSQLGDFRGHINASSFAQKFVQAVNIAHIDPYRATTHNKGILNGVDAVIIATGNDFRAVEACMHTYASSSGTYKSLSSAHIDHQGRFVFQATMPIALGTVGGLTSLHPLAKKSLEILGNPDAKTLMGIVACVGLAQNFAAIKSLITTGIQKGHMKMHLSNIIAQLKMSVEEARAIEAHFASRLVSMSAVKDFLYTFREMRKDSPEIAPTI